VEIRKKAYFYNMAVFVVTEVLDDGATVKLIVTGSEPIYVPKPFRVESKAGFVKIYTDTSNYQFDEALVTDPAHADAADLADQIQGFLDSGGLGGGATEAKQDDAIALLAAIDADTGLILLNVSSIEGKVAEETTQVANGVKLDAIKTATEFLTTPAESSETQLTVPGATPNLSAENYNQGTFQYVIGTIDTDVVVRFEGSLDGTNFYNLDVTEADTTQTTNGTFAAKFTGKNKFVRFNFVSESGGTAATIDVDIMLGN